MLLVGQDSQSARHLFADQPLGELASLRWQSRMIVVEGQIPDAIACLRAGQPAIDARDFLWFVQGQASLQTNYSGPLNEALGQRYFS